MPAICFFCTLEPSPGQQRHDNQQRLPKAFAAAGWQVHLADHQSLSLMADGLRLQPDNSALADFDLIWILGFGPRHSFLDRMQLLATLPTGRFVNSPQSLLLMHGKYFLPLSGLQAHHPRSFASADPALLLAQIQQGGDWILKPPAGSYGRQVFKLNAADPNLHVILDALTGHGDGEYCLLQAYEPRIGQGEKRILLVDGQVLGAYLRQPAQDHRANLAQEGQALPTTLSAEELALAQQAGSLLRAQQIRFLALDMAYPWIVEYNLVNPGGLETLEKLHGKDLTPQLVAMLSAGGY